MSNFESNANLRHISGDYKRNGIHANHNSIPVSRPVTESPDYRSHNGPRQINQYDHPRSGPPVIYRNKETAVSGSNRNSYPVYPATRSKQNQLPANDQSQIRHINPPAEMEKVGYRRSYEDDKGLPSRNTPGNHRYGVNQDGNRAAGNDNARNVTSTDPHNQSSSQRAIPDHQRTRAQGKQQNRTLNIFTASELNRNRNVNEETRQNQRSESQTDNNVCADFTERNRYGQQRAEISRADEKNHSLPNAASNFYSVPSSEDYSNQMHGQQLDHDRFAGDHFKDDKMGYVPPEPRHQYNEYGCDPKRSMGNNTASSMGRRDESNDNRFRRIHVTEHMNDNGATRKKPLVQDDMWTKTRELDGIPLLVELISNNFPEVHRKACDALKNLSFGETNDDIKIAIKNAGGVLALSQLLNSSKDDEVKDLITEALWNLSSCEDLQMSIIDNGMRILVSKNIIPHRRQLPLPADPTGHWTNVFLHTTGIIRNVSSAGFNARMRLRECDGLIESIIDELQSAVQQNDYGGKCIENCVVILRNLSYRLQEVDDPDFHLKRSEIKEQTSKGKLSLSTLFSIAGMVRKKKIGQHKDAETSGTQGLQLMVLNRKGVDALWQPTTLSIYLQLIRDCSNLLTCEAALGAIQNLTAYEWQPAVDVRSNVRIQKGLPVIAECLSAESDKVVCCAANLLRNLAFDLRNRELLGKYVMLDLVTKLSEYLSFVPASDDVVCAILVTMYELVKGSSDSAKSLLNEGGVHKLLLITQSDGKYLPRTIKYASMVLQSMWKYKELHYEYLRNEFTKQQFMMVTGTPRRIGSGKGLKDSSLATSSSTNDAGPNAFSLLQPMDKRSKKQSVSMIDIRWHNRPSAKASEERKQRKLPTYDERGEHRNDTEMTPNHIQVNRQDREGSRTQYSPISKQYQQEPPQYTREKPYRTQQSREDPQHENHSPYGQGLIPSLVGTKSPRGGSWI